MTRLAKNRLEWLVFAVGLALVAGTVGFLAWDALRGSDSPPDLAVELGPPRAQGEGWSVPVVVRNRGQQTAEGAHVEVVLELPGGEKEEAQFDAAYVPRGSRVRGWVHFDHPPAAGRLSGRVTGYEEP